MSGGNENLRGMANEWISYAEAARIAACSQRTIGLAVRDGLVTSRHAGLNVPALDRRTVERFAVMFAERRAYRERARRIRAAKSGPPDMVNLWLTPDEAGDVLGVTGSRIRQLVNTDRLPHTRRGRRIWIRLDHAEQAAAARGFWG